MNTNDHRQPEQLELAFEASPLTGTAPVATATSAPKPRDTRPAPPSGRPAPPNTSGEKRASLKALGEALRQELERLTSCRISLTVTNNTSNLMSVAVAPGGTNVRLRLHHMFLDAPEPVRLALAHWVRHPRSRKHADCFRAYIASRDHQIRKPLPSAARVNTRGSVYDLQPMFDELNAIHFNSSVQAAITWGKGSSAAMRSIRFGAYYDAARLIRIHPRLDQDFVPSFVVRYIVYHEMLHAHLGVCRNENGRRQIHPRGFKIMESSFPEYQKATAWIGDPENLNRMLRGRKVRRRK